MFGTYCRFLSNNGLQLFLCCGTQIDSMSMKYGIFFQRTYLLITQFREKYNLKNIILLYQYSLGVRLPYRAYVTVFIYYMIKHDKFLRASDHGMLHLASCGQDRWPIRGYKHYYSSQIKPVCSLSQDIWFLYKRNYISECVWVGATKSALYFHIGILDQSLSCGTNNFLVLKSMYGPENCVTMLHESY